MAGKQLGTGQLVWQLTTRAEKKRLALLYVLMVVGALLEMLSLGLVIPAVGVLTNPDYADRIPLANRLFGDLTQSQFVYLVMLILALVFFAKSIFLVSKMWVQKSISNAISFRLGVGIFETYMRQPYAFHLMRNSAVLTNNAQNGRTVASEVIDPSLYVLSEVLVTGGIFSLLLWMEPVGTIGSIFLFGVSSYLFSKYTKSRILRWGAARNAHREIMMQQFQQGFGGVKDIKMLGREAYITEEYARELSGDVVIEKRFQLFQTMPRYGLELVAVLCFCSLICLMTVIGKDVSEIVPVLSLFGVAAFRLLPSANQLLLSIQTIRFAQPRLLSLYEDSKLVHQIDSSTDSSLKFVEEIRIRDLSFTYDAVIEPALSSVNLVVRRGEAVGIIGSSGSGKSTLVDVLLGLLQPSGGQMLVDKQDIQTNLRSWQNQIGYVPQTIFLTDDSLRRNIALGLPDNLVDEEAVVDALRAAQLQDFVAGLPDGLDTVVGERGVRLSGGQRQRIGIARALYNKPEVLVLDEATSSLDTETEHEVMKAVQALQGTKTVVIVAHRLSTVEYCDRLYRLENARVVDEGTFSEVMNRSREN
jgi:ABC-type multidrug transport system fused ATPase/permease subunit